VEGLRPRDELPGPGTGCGPARWEQADAGARMAREQRHRRDCRLVAGKEAVAQGGCGVERGFSVAFGCQQAR
jgi:hypothetical protein